MNEKENLPVSSDSVPWYGYVALVFAILFFSGIFNTASGWLKVFDFGALLGKFGMIQGADGVQTIFQGKGGLGAREGFLFALTLAPSVMLALGVVEIVTHLKGLTAAQRMLTPVLHPLLGIPGICSLALISSLQSSDSAAGMTKELHTNQQMSNKERLIFSSFQFSAGGTINNYVGTGSALFAFLTLPIIVPLIVVFFFKFFGANLVRLYLKRFTEEDVT